MFIKSDTVKGYDVELVATTVLAIVLLTFIAFNLSPENDIHSRVSQLKYTVSKDKDVTFDDVFLYSDTKWTPTSSPVNLGMGEATYWFSFMVSPTESQGSRFLLEVDYSLLDTLDVAIYRNVGTTPLATYSAGDISPFLDRAIKHEKPLFPLPSSAQSQRVLVKVETAGTIRLPIRVWEEAEFIEFTSTQNLMMGLFFGFLCAMGINNAFLFLTTKRRSFIYYSGYVFNLALTLAALHGFGYAYLWSEQVWFQTRAVVIFANITILFATIFTRDLLPIVKHSKRIDNMLKIISWSFGISIIISFIMPYSILIKLFLAMLAVVVIFIIAVGIWLSIKGETIARYFTIAWGFLLISGMSASLDNVGLIDLSISSSNLLIIGGTLETLILAFVLAISYSHSRDDLIKAQQFALAQEVQANTAKENLLEVQKRYQDDLEYKVEERTLELEITLRELSEVNNELERLTSIDPLTGMNNRRHFDKRLKSEGRRSRREQTPLSVAVIDIDHFKQVNDSFGHTGGDACLIQVSKALQSELNRLSDDLCRIGGEEFALILPNTELSGATHVVETMRQAIDNLNVEFDGHHIPLSISVGVTTAIMKNEEHVLALLKFADELLYKAKESGRNTVIHQEFIG